MANDQLREVLNKPKILKNDLKDNNLTIRNNFEKDFKLFLTNKSAVDNILDSVDRLDVSLNISNDFDKFNNNSSNIKEKINSNLHLLNNYQDLDKLLNLNKELNLHLNNNNYKDFLHLLDSFKSITIETELSKKLSTDINSTKIKFKNKLLRNLKLDKRLNELNKQIKYLNLVFGIDYHQLSIIYLKSRLFYYVEYINNYNNNNIELLINNYFDFTRQFLLDLISQFQSIFTFNQTNILTFLPFIKHVFTILFNLINKNFNKIDNYLALSSISGTLTYINQSFSLIGLDISSFISTLIENSIINLLSISFTQSTGILTNKLQESLKSKTPLSNLLINDITQRKLLSNKQLNYKQLTQFSFEPPQDLTNHPLLANWLNSFINDLNSLRLFAPISIKYTLLKSLDDSLISIARIFSVLLIHNPINNQPADINLKSLYFSIYAFIYQILPYSRNALMKGIYDHDIIPPVNQELQSIIDRLVNWLDKFKL